MYLCKEALVHVAQPYMVEDLCSLWDGTQAGLNGAEQSQRLPEALYCILQQPSQYFTHTHTQTHTQTHTDTHRHTHTAMCKT